MPETLTEREQEILLLAWNLGRDYERCLLADLEEAANRAVRLTDQATADRWARWRAGARRG